MNKARNIVAPILIATMFCALLTAVVLHRQILDAALLYSFYLQPKDFQESQCGSYTIKEGFDECWAPYFRDPNRVPMVDNCWAAFIHSGVCGDWSKDEVSLPCIGRASHVCEWLYPE